MSYHYPHHVGKIVPAERATTRALAHAGAAEKILPLARAHDRLGPWFGALIASDGAASDLKWNEGATLAGGLLLPFVTALLIWAALAEAVLAAAGAL